VNINVTLTDKNNFEAKTANTGFLFS